MKHYKQLWWNIRARMCTSDEEYQKLMAEAYNEGLDTYYLAG